MVLRVWHPAVARGQLPLWCQAQEAPQGWAHHSLEPGWGRRPGLAPAPLSSAESGKQGRKRGRDGDDTLPARHFSPLIYLTFMTTLGGTDK